jgi:hypothetical protein
MGVLLAILLMSVQGSGATVQTAPVPQRFSGTWVLDEGRSVLYAGQGGGALTYVVVDEPSTVKVTQRRPDGENAYSVPADGKPHDHAIEAGRFTHTLRREKGALVFQIAFTRAADKASISYTERWSLSDGGRTLTVYRVFPGGQEDLRVFTKKE